jgi:hypothetical protein
MVAQTTGLPAAPEPAPLTTNEANSAALATATLSDSG